MSSTSSKESTNGPKAKATRLFWTMCVSLCASFVIVPVVVLHWGGEVLQTSLRGIGGSFVSLQVRGSDLPFFRNLEKGTISYAIEDGTADVLTKLPANVEQLDLTMTIEQGTAKALTVEPKGGESRLVWADSSNWSHLPRKEEWNGLFLRRTEAVGADGDVDPRTIPYEELASIDGSSLGEAVVGTSRPMSVALRGVQVGEVVLSAGAPSISTEITTQAPENVPQLELGGSECEITTEWDSNNTTQEVLFSCPEVRKGVHAFMLDPGSKTAELRELYVSTGGVRMQNAQYSRAANRVTPRTCVFAVGERVRVTGDAVSALTVNNEAVRLESNVEQSVELPEEQVYEVCITAPEAQIRVEKGWFVANEEDVYRLPLRTLESFIQTEERPLAILSRVGLEHFSRKRDHVIEIPIDQESGESTTILRTLGGTVRLTDVRMAWKRDEEFSFTLKERLKEWSTIWKQLIGANDNS